MHEKKKITTIRVSTVVYFSDNLQLVALNRNFEIKLRDHFKKKKVKMIHFIEEKMS